MDLGKRDIMKREDILKRSRSEHMDEGMVYAQNKGYKLGYVIFLMVILLIMFINIFNNQSNYSTYVMFWAVSGACSFPQYRFTKNKLFLWSTILSSFTAICFLIMFIFESRM